MCKYLFSSGQVPKKSFLEPSFIQYIDSVAYLHCQHIPIYIQKICKSWNKYIKIHETIYTSSPQKGFSSYKVFTFLQLHISPPSLPNTRHKEYTFFSYLHRHLNTVSSSENYIFFLYGTLAFLPSVLCTSYGCKENLLLNLEQKSNNS